MSDVRRVLVLRDALARVIRASDALQDGELDLAEAILEDFQTAVVALGPRDDRVPDRPVFGGFGVDRFLDRDHPRLHRRWNRVLLTARSPSPTRLPPPRSGTPVGADRRSRRTRGSRDDLRGRIRTSSSDEQELDYAKLLAA